MESRSADANLISVIMSKPDGNPDVSGSAKDVKQKSKRKARQMASLLSSRSNFSPSVLMALCVFE
jgi:hypothetical protein